MPDPIVSGVKWFETKWCARLTEYLAHQFVNHLRIDLTDGGAPYMDIGLLVAGQLWRLQGGTAYGIREGRVMLDRRDRNPYTGAAFPDPSIVNLRMAAFTLPALSTPRRATNIVICSAVFVRHGIRFGFRKSRTPWRTPPSAGTVCPWRRGGLGWWRGCEVG
jgi:hypothetical protein